MKTNVFTTKETIFGQVEVVRLEIESKQKKLSACDEELVQKILDKVVVDNREFATEKEQLRYLSALTREMVWQEANTEESAEIISRLKLNDNCLRKSSSTERIHTDATSAVSAQRYSRTSSRPTRWMFL